MKLKEITEKIDSYFEFLSKQDYEELVSSGKVTKVFEKCISCNRTNLNKKENPFHCDICEIHLLQLFQKELVYEGSDLEKAKAHLKKYYPSGLPKQIQHLQMKSQYHHNHDWNRLMA